MPIEFVIENSKAKKINNTGNPNILTIRLLKINEINDQKIALTKKKKINVEIKGKEVEMLKPEEAKILKTKTL